MTLVPIAGRLRGELRTLRFGTPVTHVYDPLDYAWSPHELYLRRFGAAPREIVLLGMNPGPWGMMQTGVPFGTVSIVRDWLGIEAKVNRPTHEHPARPIHGFGCRREEVSGLRLWGWAGEQFGTADRFFERFFVANYCPLGFLEASGRNRTPNKLPAQERLPLFALCDRALKETVAYLKPRWLIGVGRFAESRAKEVALNMGVTIGHIPHPSPASPEANSGWAAQCTRRLKALGIQFPFDKKPAKALARRTGLVLQKPHGGP